MKNCWEFKNCGREKGGQKVDELGECIASIEGLGHSCWAIAGTLCGGAVQGSVAQKEKNCMACEVYKLYHRLIGTEGKRIATELPEEQEKYNAMLRDRTKRKQALGGHQLMAFIRFNDVPLKIFARHFLSTLYLQRRHLSQEFFPLLRRFSVALRTG